MTISFAQSRKILTINITLQTINIFFGLPGTSTMWRENLDQSSQRKLKKLFLLTTNFKEDLQHKMQVWATHFYYEMIMNSSQCLLLYSISLQLQRGQLYACWRVWYDLLKVTKLLLHAFFMFSLSFPHTC